MRNSSLGVVALVAVLALAGTSPAGAVITNPIVDFGSGFAREGTRVVDDHVSVAGDTLLIVGHVVAFNDPFADLDPNDPTVEYTYAYRNLVSQGTVVSGFGSFVFYDTDYTGGILEVYRDPSQNADFANPATFMDGEMILQAELSNFHTSTKSFNCAGTQNADLLFVGGTLFNRVSVGGTGFDGIITGLFSVCASFVDDPREAEGYFALSDTKIDVNPPVAAEPTTWGRIKKLY